MVASCYPFFNYIYINKDSQKILKPMKKLVEEELNWKHIKMEGMKWKNIY